MAGVSDDAFAEELKQFVLPDESAAAFLARCHVEPFLTSIPFIDKQNLRAGHVLEIYGATGTAKTQILLQIAVTCILPKQSDEVIYGGFGSSALYFDLDCRLDVGRLLQLLQARINEARRSQGFSPIAFGFPTSGQMQEATKPFLHPLISSCLERFHLIRCHSSFQFLASLKTIRRIFRRLDDAALTMTHLLFIDSISAFYWMDRAARTSVVPTPALRPSGRPLNLPVVADAIVTELRQLMRSYKLLVIAARISLFNPNTSDNYWHRGNARRSSKSDEISETDREASNTKQGDLPSNARQRRRDSRPNFMPAVWQEFVTHAVRLEMHSNVAGGKEKETFQAVWDLPQSVDIDLFRVDTGGIRSIGRRG